MSLLIGLHGHPGTGKDTIADRLQTMHGFKRGAFADALKDELCRAFVCFREYFERREYKPKPTAQLALINCRFAPFVDWYLFSDKGREEVSLYGLTEVMSMSRAPRWLMQTWGTDYRKAEDPGYWIKQLLAKIPDQGDFVVTDVRFEDEAEALTCLGSYSVIWEVRRPNNPLHEASGHVSNHRLPATRIDNSLYNVGTLVDLFKQTDTLLALHRNKIDIDNVKNGH